MAVITTTIFQKDIFYYISVFYDANITNLFLISQSFF